MTASQFNQLSKLVDNRRRAIEASGKLITNSEFCMGYKRWTSRGIETGTWDLTHRIEVYAKLNHRQELKEILQAVGLKDELEETIDRVKAVFYKSI